MAGKAKRRLATDIRASLYEVPAFEIGSGNIFADLGLPNAEEHLLKASLVVQLHRLIKARKLTQVAAAKLIGVKQPDLSVVS
jgi:predicted XRE-type DNA-binding protein